MSALFSNILTNTTSRYQNLRQQLLNSEADGDTEDDSHISRVLRAYYTEKGRPFPQWLPPDPKAPQAAPAQFASSRQQGQAQPMGGRGGGLSDLWDAPQQQQPQEPQSLRRGPGTRGGGARPMQGRAGMGNSLTPEPQSQGRPLPSQRAGSYQSSLGQGGRQAEASPPPSAGSGSTAQERLKARLWGRSNSPAPSAASDAGSQSSRVGAYDRPVAQGGRAPYQDDGSNSVGSAGSGGGGGRQQSSPSTAANSPWVGNDDPYGPGYDRGPPQRGPAGGRVGLPSGPRLR
ncbi:GTPase activating protein [Pleosporales sp. CAS-2024a]